MAVEYPLLAPESSNTARDRSYSLPRRLGTLASRFSSFSNIFEAKKSQKPCRNERWKGDTGGHAQHVVPTAAVAYWEQGLLPYFCFYKGARTRFCVRKLGEKFKTLLLFSHFLVYYCKSDNSILRQKLSDIPCLTKK